jgi:uncharacterized protein (DUF305 family)
MSEQESERARMRRWLQTWASAGPRLDQERWDRLAAMTEAQAQRALGQVLELGERDWPSDDGEGLLLQQRVFALARRKR